MANAFEQVVAPVEGAVFGGATSTTAVRLELPDRWKGGYIRIYAITADLYYVLGDSAVDCVAADNNTVTSEVITDKDTVGAYIPAGGFEDVWVPHKRVDAAGADAAVTHLAYEATDVGRIAIRKSSV